MSVLHVRHGFDEDWRCIWRVEFQKLYLKLHFQSLLKEEEFDFITVPFATDQLDGQLPHFCQYYFMIPFYHDCSCPNARNAQFQAWVLSQMPSNFNYAEGYTQL